VRAYARAFVLMEILGTHLVDKLLIMIVQLLASSILLWYFSLFKATSLHGYIHAIPLTACVSNWGYFEVHIIALVVQENASLFIINGKVKFSRAVYIFYRQVAIMSPIIMWNRESTFKIKTSIGGKYSCFISFWM